ncbi:hypothetical protein EOC94_08230 [Mesorhizobium sp. M6A.T.Ce.TU.016.01.1.1]|nr:hypothetical protein EOC94_08230 [Mesorhizobium sp. M6A.T.Ce.TU.016.01.1.1]
MPVREIILAARIGLEGWIWQGEGGVPTLPSPLVGEGGRAKLGRMRGAPAWHRRHSVQHPSSVLALHANPPSPTRGEGKRQALP